jgi:hypothetical protein
MEIVITIVSKPNTKPSHGEAQCARVKIWSAINLLLPSL